MRSTLKLIPVLAAVAAVLVFIPGQARAESRNALVAEQVQDARAAAARARAAADEARALADAARAGAAPAAPDATSMMKAGSVTESAISVPGAEVVPNPDTGSAGFRESAPAAVLQQ